MIAEKVFHVLTEFRFEIGSAVASSGVLQEQLGKISNAADQATNSLNYMVGGFAASAGLNLSGFGAGFISIMSAAVGASEKFRDSQLSLINLMSSNQDKLTGPIDTFAEKGIVAGTIMRDIADQARKFALPESQLLDMTKTMGAMLIPKGLAGDNLSGAIDLSRNLLKSAPNLGIDPTEVQGQLLRTIEGGASMGDTLFKRLVGETDAFKDFSGKGGTKKFNELDAATRFERLQKALSQFSSDTSVLEERINSISGQTQIFRDTLTGANGVLLGLGNTIRTVIVQALQHVNELLNNQGRRLATVANALIGTQLADPQNLMINILQMRKLQEDMGKTKDTMQFAGIVQAVAAAIAWLTKRAMFLVPVVGWLAVGFGVMQEAAAKANNPIVALAASISKWITILLALGAVLAYFGILSSALAVVFGVILVPMGLIFAMMQILSRAMAIANVNDAKAAPELIARGAEALLELKYAVMDIIEPLLELGDTMARMIAPMFSISTYGDTALSFIGILTRVAQGINLVIVTVLASISAYISGIVQLAAEIASFSFTRLMSDPVGYVEDINKNVAKTAMDEFSSFIANAGSARFGTTEGNGVASNNTHIAKVEVHQQFKEQQEPDRIARSLVKTLSDIGKNPTQAAGGSMQSALMR